VKIFSAETWTLNELEDQVQDAGRRVLLIPPADTRRMVLQTFAEALDVPDQDGLDLDDLNDALHDFADTATDGGQAAVTVIWQVRPGFRTDRAFGIMCEILQDAESYAGKDLSVIAVFQ